METSEGTQGRLFATPIDTFIAQVSWRAGEGWRLWVSSWDVGDAPARAHSATYTLLTADEVVDVLCAEQQARCEWLRSPLAP